MKNNIKSVIKCPFLPKYVCGLLIENTITYCLFLSCQVSCVLAQQQEYNGQLRSTNIVFFSEIKKNHKRVQGKCNFRFPVEDLMGIRRVMHSY